MRETGWTLTRRRGKRAQLRGFLEMAPEPSGSNPGGRFAVVAGAGPLPASVPYAISCAGVIVWQKL